MLVLLLTTFAIASADSEATLHTARAAQAEFERVRREQMAWSRGGHTGKCDEVVGRFCFWYDEADSWTPRPEPAAVRAARTRLLASLDSLNALSPGDDWIVGQRIRYLVEAGAYDESLAAAAACRATSWWCAALQGFALHAGRHYAGADTAFARALAAMPEPLRCQWTDLSDVLGDLRGRYHKLTCGERADLEHRIWWLADPLYLVPGNERRTEHFARRVMERLQDHAASGYGMPWGADLTDLLIRYGWPTAWERERPLSAAALRPGIISHNARGARRFLPPAAFVIDPTAIGPDDWDTDPDRPTATYAPAYADSVLPLSPQVAVFWRDTFVVVVAGYDLAVPFHLAPESGRTRRSSAALVLSPDPDSAPLLVRAEHPGLEGTLLAIAPAQAALLSVEALTAGDSALAARQRYWLPLVRPAGLHLSDPLLLRISPDDSLPSTLADAVSQVRGAARAAPGERIGVFWETYGLDAVAQPSHVTLTVIKRGGGFLRSVARFVGLARRNRTVVGLSWEEPAHPGAAVAPRALALSLANASPGRYTLRIEVRAPDGTSATASRELNITADR